MSKQPSRRVARRASVRLPADYVQGGQGRGFAEIVELSAGGCILGQVLLDPSGPEVFLNFRLGADPREIGVRGRVASVREGVGTGIEFTSISPDDRDLLRRFVEKKPAEKNPRAKRS